MAILKVARMGHPVLRAKARAIDPAQITSPPLQQLIDDMFETMHEYQGVGLAAPQIHESLRLFVAESGVEMTFRKGDKGQVTSVTLRIGSCQDSEAKRVE